MKKAIKAILCIVLAVVLLAGGYMAYVFIDYSRLDDMLVLDAVNPYADGSASAAPMTAGEEKTIMTWNIGFGAYTPDFSFFMDGGKAAQAASRESVLACTQGVIDFMNEREPELALIQEVDVRGTRSHHVDQLALLQQGNADMNTVYAQNYDSAYFVIPLPRPIGANRGGILTLSDAGIESALRRSLPIEGGFRKLFDLDRCYSVSRIPVDNGKTLCLYNLHLSAYTSDGTIATEQLGILLEDMAAEYAAGNYVIAGGDFNKDLLGDSALYSGVEGTDASWCKPFPTELLPEGIRLVYDLDEENPVFTCRNADRPYEKGVSFEVTLDGFMVSDNVQVVSCEVVDLGFAVSDHQPVLMDFVLTA